MVHCVSPDGVSEKLNVSGNFIWPKSSEPRQAPFKPNTVFDDNIASDKQSDNDFFIFLGLFRHMISLPANLRKDLDIMRILSCSYKA